MTGICLRAATVAAVVCAAVGCVHTHHTGYDTAIRCAADHPLKPAVRSQVHLFVLNGIDPTEDAELFRLRDELARAGFPMVHYAQRGDADFFYREMHRVVRDQPPARLLLVGFGLAAQRTRELACTVAGDGLPLDALVLLDPAGGSQIVEDRVPTTVVRSHRWPLGRDIPTADVTELAGVGHLSLPAHPQTVATLVRLLTDSASRVDLESPARLPHLSLTDFPQPPPRPDGPIVATPADPAIKEK